MGKTLAAALMVAAVAVGAIAMSARAAVPREIRIVARGMTFYLEGQTDPNPTLRLRTGETVRLILKNEDAGMTHDFAIPEWNAVTKTIEAGQETTLRLKAPDRPSSQGYNCRPHAAFMRGTILVE